MRMKIEDLENLLEQDVQAGLQPFFVCGAFGTTGSCAIDPLSEIARLKEKYNFWFHVDGAYAGAALCYCDVKKMADGMEKADSIVINPHKWMMTTFDCSAFFVRNPSAVENAFSILPEYLRTTVTGKVKDLRDFGPSLGRRFRALKLWFVMRYYGTDQLREQMENHIKLSEQLERLIKAEKGFELVVPRNLNVICFRYKVSDIDEENNKFNESLLNSVNAQRNQFLSHTKLHGTYTIRFVIGAWMTEWVHVESAWQEITKIVSTLRK